MRIDTLTNLLLKRAWDDNINDNDRLLLEQAAVTIDRLARRCLRVSQELERVEFLQQEGREYDGGL
ncbi:MAG: hypothetical protein ACO3LT_09085 [Ilumatobacteraceae bacterium]|jgi:hypothetical protein